MHLQELEYAAQVVFAMCRQHPELCPHDFTLNSVEESENTKVEHYECVLCGIEATREVGDTEENQEEVVEEVANVEE